MKFIVWINEDHQGWEPNGDGPMTEKQAQRTSAEVRRYCIGCKAKYLPVGVDAENPWVKSHRVQEVK